MEDFQVLAQLGKGGFGICYKTLDKKADFISVVKKIPFSTVEDVYNISKEIQVLPFILTKPLKK